MYAALKYWKLSVLIFTFLVFGCNEKESTEPSDENLLLNTSFEKNGKFSTDGWILPALSDSSTDVPSRGGNVSLVLEATQPPEVFAETMVAANTQFNNYQFSLWSKYSVVEGKAVLSLIRNGSEIKSLSVVIDDIVWRNYNITDTFNVVTGDSFKIQLSAGIAPLLPGETYFDLCRLQGLE